MLQTGRQHEDACGREPGLAYIRRGHLQLRDQHDNRNTLLYQFEPVWKFATGTVGYPAHRL
jgi:hypothetical protein